MAAGMLPKAKLVGERLTSGAIPVPVRVTVCGLSGALSVNVTVAVRVPAALGLNVTLILHWADGGIDVPQSFFKVKSPALGPVT